MILDSGNRRKFESGAVRDMQEGKGRMDLVPLEVVSELLVGDPIIGSIKDFIKSNHTKYLRIALGTFAIEEYHESIPTMILEVSKHFEEGAKKYGENNWQKGLPPKCYIDSALRHYMKYLRGDQDEPHDRAFVWNLMCCIWEVDHHKPEEEKIEPKKEQASCLNCRYRSSGKWLDIHCDECRYYSNWDPEVDK